MHYHHVMSFSDLFASSLAFIFTSGHIINCFQHAAFTVFLRDGEGPHVDVQRGFVRPSEMMLTTNGIQMFCELADDICLFWRIFHERTRLSTFCPHAQFLHSVWIPASGCAAARKFQRHKLWCVCSKAVRRSRASKSLQVELTTSISSATLEEHKVRCYERV